MITRQYRAMDDAGGLLMSVAERMIVSDKVLPDVTELLAEDHRQVEAWFDAYERLTDAAHKAYIAHLICTAIKAHAGAEEVVLYPFVRAATADNALVDRSLDEHRHIKDLIAAIEVAEPGGLEMDELVRRLAQETRLHIIEEEGRLFTELRQTKADLYAIGAEVAGRRMELMAADTGKSAPRTHAPLKPYYWRADMHQSSAEVARSLFIAGLRDAHAMERQSQEMLEQMLARIENYPQVRERIAQHLDETLMQKERIEKILDLMGEDRSRLKDMAMTMMGAMSAMGNAMAEDEIIKNSLASYAFENFEIASYEGLITLGEEAGRTDVLRMLGMSLNEERGMANWLAEHLREVTLLFLHLKSQGLQASR